MTNDGGQRRRIVVGRAEQRQCRGDVVHRCQAHLFAGELAQPACKLVPLPVIEIESGANFRALETQATVEHRFESIDHLRGGNLGAGGWCAQGQQGSARCG